MSFENLFREEKGLFELRGIHFDLKGLPPTSGRLLEILKILAAARYNFVLVEWEDAFPWTVDERFRSETAYSPEEVEEFHRKAGELGIEIISLVQCLGHMETPLKVPGYENLRELPDNSGGMNPLAPGARDLVQSMVDDVLKLTPGVKYFHLGGDEVGTLGMASETKAYIEEHGKGALYLQHVEPIVDALNERGVRPILWHDMMTHWDDEALVALAAKCDLMVWGYAGHPDDSWHHFNTKHVKRFAEHNVPMWCACAYKGADGSSSDLPNIEERQINTLGWADLARRFKFKGCAATGWSRYNTDNVQCEPIDSSLDSLVNTGVMLYDGEKPAGGLEACVAALEGIGEKERFEICRDAMAALNKIRTKGWNKIKLARELLVLCRNDSTRDSIGVVAREIRNLKQLVEDTENVKSEVREAFSGLVADKWIEEYIATRLDPFKDELAAIQRVKQVGG